MLRSSLHTSGASYCLWLLPLLWWCLLFTQQISWQLVSASKKHTKDSSFLNVYLHACIYNMSLPGACWGYKMALDHLELFFFLFWKQLLTWHLIFWLGYFCFNHYMYKIIQYWLALFWDQACFSWNFNSIFKHEHRQEDLKPQWENATLMLIDFQLSCLALKPSLVLIHWLQGTTVGSGSEEISRTWEPRW